MNKHKNLLSVLALPLLALLTACFGSSSNDGGIEGIAESLHGVAAVGEPVAGATVSLRCNGGDFGTSTNTTGLWSVDVPEEALPCIIRASGGVPDVTLYSFAGSGGRTNITPFTTLVVARAAVVNSGVTNVDDLFHSDAPRPTGLAAAVQNANEEFLTDLIGAGYRLPAGFDVFSHEFEAVSGDPHDGLLERFAEALARESVGFEDFVLAYIGNAPLPAAPEDPGEGPGVPATCEPGGEATLVAQVDGEEFCAVTVFPAEIDLAPVNAYAFGGLEANGAHLGLIVPLEVGEVELADPPFEFIGVGGWYVASPTAQESFLSHDIGQITVTDVSATRVAGTFEFVGVGYHQETAEPTGNEVTVISGVFGVPLTTVERDEPNGTTVERDEPNGGSPAQGLSPGTFRAEITGAVTTVLEGVASFGSSEEEGGFGLTLGALGPDGISLNRGEAGRPSPGSYPVVGFQSVLLESAGFWGVVFLTEGGGFFFSESGTLTITGSSENELAGELAFSAAGGLDGMETVTVEASFRAQ
ncbi:hypothetical protein [Aquisalimonas sp.]|uniref:hypothetical protein n=1 Tax=Aquisalimonas sp. TaxID=1872621 RepID=UPI0025B9CE0C|nr:hypothetical protein [Aquisalimonas sp.]